MQNLFKTIAFSNRLSLALLLLRCVAGLAFMYHGWSKIQNPLTWMGPSATVPPFFQGAAAVSEFCGGLLWILGLLTPLASFGIGCTMAFATWFHILVRHDPFVSNKGGGSYENALVYLAIAFLLLLAGPGRFSLDRLFFGERR